MARRRYQRGSVFLRGTREPVWVGRWREDVKHADGSIRRVRRTEVLGTHRELPTKRLAQRELQARVESVNDPHYHALRSATFAEFAVEWQSLVLHKHKASTRSSMNSQLRTALVPFFGAYPLREIDWQLVQRFISQCSLAPKTCKNHVLLLKLMWKSARAGGWVSATHNPFTDLTLPKVPASAPYFYTAGETRRIIESAEGQYKTLFWLAAETGLRAGELCGLRREDVLLDQFAIRVVQSAWRGLLQTPKTANARRLVAISLDLACHLEMFFHGWQPNTHSLVFVSTSDGPLHPSTVQRDILRPICKALELPCRGLKAFRHGSATLMDQAGVPMKTRQERLGHAPGSKVTMSNYTHTVPGDQRIAADLVGQMLVG